MNSKEYQAYQKTKKKRDNYENLEKIVFSDED